MASPLQKDVINGVGIQGFLPSLFFIPLSMFVPIVFRASSIIDHFYLLPLFASPYLYLSFLSLSILPLNDDLQSQVEILGILSKKYIAYELHKKVPFFNYVSIYATIMSINQLFIYF